jgi:predicted ester cyclase
MAPFLAAFPDIHHRVVRTVQAGDMVAIEVEITGTHTEPSRRPGGELPPTGQSIAFTAANFWRVADGRITRYHVYFDTATLMGQLSVGSG